MHTRHNIILTVILTILVPPPSLLQAQDSQAQPTFDRFQFFAECGPIGMVIEYPPDSAREIGLTQDRITVMVESRLRAARLYDNGQLPDRYVHIVVGISGPVFTSTVGFSKNLYDPATGQINYAETWSRTWIGPHDNDASTILQQLSEVMDQFLVHYLRVNEATCR